MDTRDEHSTPSTYSDSAYGLVITRKRALHECRKHHVDGADMLAELGDREIYTATEVLEWLGY